MNRKYRAKAIGEDFGVKLANMFDKTNRSGKIKITIKSVSFRDRVDSTVFLLLGDSVFKKAAIKKSSNSRGTLGANMFEHFITNAYGTTGLVIR